MSSLLNSIAITDTERLLHPYTNARKHEVQGPIIIERGEGIRVFDQEGRSYIEGMAGLWSVAVGFSETRLAEAAHRQMQMLPYYHCFSHKTHAPVVRLAERLIEMSPPNMSRVFFTSSGSEANDTVIKMLWYMNNALGRPEKKKFLARAKGYHGITVASGSLTGLPNNHRDFDLPAIPVVHLTCPHHYRFGLDGESETAFAARLIAEAEEVILREGPETIAAFIGEPLMGAGGVMPPPAGYWKGIEALCRKHDIVLFADEVINGFGRLGKAFGCMHYDFTPDIIVASKQLTSSYMPLATIIFTEAIYDAIADNTKKIGTFGHGFTASGHPVACAVALENLDIIAERDLIGNAAARAPAFQAGLRQLSELPFVGEVRGDGLIAAVEMVANKATRAKFATPGRVGAAAFDICHEEGLIIRSIEDSLALCPPLIVTEGDVTEIVGRMRRIVERVGQFIVDSGLDRPGEVVSS
jgi:4-aminobutyrate--pyruvate transaminase